MIQKKIALSLYLVTQRHNISEGEFVRIIEQALQGGVTLVQLREKDVSTSEFIELGRKIKKLTDAYNVPLIINDRVDVAWAVKAAGVHLGQEDMNPTDARSLLGPEALIGLSVENEEQAMVAQDLPVDYIAASPLFATTTKSDVGEPWGLERLKNLKMVSSHPIVAIGGINAETARSALMAGANGVAVVSDIFNALDPFQAAQNLLREIQACS